MSLKDRHLFGAGAAACAVCCATPVLTLLGIAGTAATVATFAFAGIVFGLVVAAGTLLAVWQQRRQRRRDACGPAEGPVDVELTATRPQVTREASAGSPQSSRRCFCSPPQASWLTWGMVFDGFKPDRWDITGAFVCLVGVAVIMYAPRNA